MDDEQRLTDEIIAFAKRDTGLGGAQSLLMSC